MLARVLLMTALMAFISPALADPIPVGSIGLKRASLSSETSVTSADTQVRIHMVSDLVVDTDGHKAIAEVSVRQSDIFGEGLPTNMRNVLVTEHRKMHGLTYEADFDRHTRKVAFENYTSLGDIQRKSMDNIMTYLQDGYLGGLMVSRGQEVFRFDVARVSWGTGRTWARGPTPCLLLWTASRTTRWWSLWTTPWIGVEIA